MTPKLIEAIAVTAELTGTTLSKAAAKVFAEDLSRYPEPQVIAALVRCRKELKGRLTLGDVISRLEDGRPGPEEAWAVLPHDEATTVVWTDEMREAWGVCLGLMDNPIQARMAFLERYKTLVQRARDEGKPVVWTPSLGHDPHGRESALLEAAEKGRLTARHVAGLLPHREEPHPRIAALLTSEQKRLAA